MKQIVLDTETTGLDTKLGNRLVEIGAVELNNRQLTGQRFHYYLNPERDSEEGALQVHGLTRGFLQDKPKFHEISHEFLEFIDQAELIIHNAPFDVSFINYELALAKLKTLDHYCAQVTDTLKLAKDLHPGKRNNLDALCERYEIDHSKRTLHGALLDAELLADVYLAMTRGQESLLIDLETADSMEEATANLNELNLIVLFANDKELQQHSKQLDRIERETNGKCLWRTIQPDSSARETN